MKQLIIKTGSILATSALVLSLVPSAFAATVDVTVNGNGSHSTTDVTVSQKTESIVKQSNTVQVVNVQSSNSSTGGNSISGTTGGNGDPSIMTGNASSTNKLTVEGGSNTAISPDCGCNPSMVTIDVSKNGTKSKTTLKVNDSTKNMVDQKTNVSVFNDQYANSKTGKNKINGTTGATDTSISTGDAWTKNKATVMTGMNFVGPSTEVL